MALRTGKSLILSLVMKSAGLGNCLSPDRRVQLMVCVGRGWYLWGVRKANGNTGQRGGLVWGDVCVSGPWGSRRDVIWSFVCDQPWDQFPGTKTGGCSVPLLFGLVTLETAVKGICENTHQGVCSSTETGSRKKLKCLYQYKDHGGQSSPKLQWTEQVLMFFEVKQAIISCKDSFLLIVSPL